MGLFIREKQKKKDFFGQFAVCQGLGTWQNDNLAIPGNRVCRVLDGRRTVKYLLFAVRLTCGAR